VNHIQGELPFVHRTGRPGSELVRWLRDVKWSYSRRGVLEQCPLRYYFEYYALRVALERGGEGADRLRFLKALQNRHERIGSIAHTVIAAFLRSARKRDLWGSGRLVDWGVSIFRRDLAFSGGKVNGDRLIAAKYTPVRLTEYFYHLARAPELCRDAEERLASGLRNFAVNSAFEEFREGGAHENAIIEGRISIKGFPCSATGTIDLAFPSGPLFKVIDWKLGEPSRDGGDSLQLATYALGLVSKGLANQEAIRAEKAYLTVGEVVHCSISDSILARARGRILQDAERMAMLHEHGIQGVAEAFTPCAQRRVCMLCSFREICIQGKAAVNG
jgi:hypothetical protein